MAKGKKIPAATPGRKPGTTSDDTQAPSKKKPIEEKAEPQEEPWDICSDFFDPSVVIVSSCFKVSEKWGFDPKIGRHCMSVHVTLVDNYESLLWGAFVESNFALAWLEVNVSVGLADRVSKLIHEINSVFARQKDLVVESNDFCVIQKDSIHLRNISIALRHKNRDINKSEIPHPVDWSTHYSPGELVRIFGWSWSTLKKRLDNQTIRNRKHTIKDYQIHIDDLPPEKRVGVD